MARRVCIVLMLATLAAALAGEGVPPPDEVRAVAQRIVSQAPYRLDRDRRRVIDWERVWELLTAPFRALDRALGGASLLIRVLVYGFLLLLLAALVAHIVYTFRAALRPRARGHVSLDETAEPEPDAIAGEASALAQHGDYAGASRLLYRASLTALERKRGGRFRRGLTNSEYLRTFSVGWVIDALRVFVDLINRKWYANRQFSQQDYAACRLAYDRIVARLREMG